MLRVRGANGFTGGEFDQDTASLVGDYQPLAMRIACAVGVLSRLDALFLPLAKPALCHSLLVRG